MCLIEEGQDFVAWFEAVDVTADRFDNSCTV